jgi:hypothetical protein
VIDAAGTTRPEVQADYTPQGAVSVLRETSAVAGQWRTTRAAFNAHGEQTASFGPRSVGAEEARTEMDRNAFGEVTATWSVSGWSQPPATTPPATGRGSPSPPERGPPSSLSTATTPWDAWPARPRTPPTPATASTTPTRTRVHS